MVSRFQSAIVLCLCLPVLAAACSGAPVKPLPPPTPAPPTRNPPATAPATPEALPTAAAGPTLAQQSLLARLPVKETAALKTPKKSSKPAP
ncbi:MAG: hypothetical protein ACE5G8_08825 [Anaerolineae bacterium]